MRKKIQAVEVDCGHDPFYWELYDPTDGSYLGTVESEDFGDYLANNKDYEFVLHQQEPFQAQYAIHMELDKFFGQPGDYLDDCDVLTDPASDLDPFCPGCKAWKDWSAGKTYGDYFGNPFLWNKEKVNV